MSLIARLKHPEHYYEFTDPKKANAVLMGLCQEAADALAAPVQAEREACAKVCEDDALSSQYGERSKYRALLATTIRARGNT